MSNEEPHQVSMDELLNRATLRADELIKQRDSARAKVADLYIQRDQAWAALAQIRALARREQAHPTQLHMTCLSLIEKEAVAVLVEWDKQHA